MSAFFQVSRYRQYTIIISRAIISKWNILKITLTFPYPRGKCESNYIRIQLANPSVHIHACIHRLIELSVYLVIIRSIMSTFHATSLTLFRQVRFFIRYTMWCLVTQRIILSLATSLWRIHCGRLIRSPVRPIKRYVCDVVHLPPSRGSAIHSNNKSVISDVSPDRGHVHRCKYFSH